MNLSKNNKDIKSQEILLKFTVEYSDEKERLRKINLLKEYIALAGSSSDIAKSIEEAASFLRFVWKERKQTTMNVVTQFLIAAALAVFAFVIYAWIWVHSWYISSGIYLWWERAYASFVNERNEREEGIVEIRQCSKEVCMTDKWNVLPEFIKYYIF